MPRVSQHAAEEIANNLFGRRGRATLLSGERDENFLLETDEGAFVLKLAHPSEDPNQIAFQTRALLHVAVRDPGLPIPRVIAARNGRHEAEVTDAQGAKRLARLFTFLPGRMVARLPGITSDGRHAIGTILGRLDRALADFVDPADSFPFTWDLTQCGSLRPLLDGVACGADRDAAARALDDFEDHVAPVLPLLERQVIHNDLTPFNLLVSEGDDTVVGIIDFGDMIRAPRINDLAVACAYHVAAEGDPIAPLLEIVASYAMVNPLTRKECDVFLDIVRARLAITVLITERNAARSPENRTYLLKNHPTAVRGLARLSGVDRNNFGTRLHRAAGLET